MNKKNVVTIQFVALAIMNILDMLLTGIGLQYGLIEEKNPIMKGIWERGPVYFYLIKLMLSIILLMIVPYARKGRTPSIIVMSLTTLAVIIYGSVMGLYFKIIVSFFYFL